MRRRILFLTALVVAGGLATTLSSQSVAPWRLSYFPYLTSSPNDGVMGIARAIWFRQAGWGERVTLDRYLAIDAGYSTRDAWRASVTFGAPRLSEDWRVMAHASASEQPHFGSLDVPTTVDRAMAVAWVDVTRRVSGPVHFALRPSVRRQRLDREGSGIVSRTDETDLSLRGAVVIDLRDREYEVNSGALLELGAIAGTGGIHEGYNAPYAHLRGYAHPLLPLRLTGRFGWRGATSSNAVTPRFEFPGWEGDFTLLGGRESHRGVPIAALSGDGALFAGAEARFDVLNVGELGAVTLLGFVDGGKPLAASSHHASAIADWTWSAGGGVALRVLRAATLTVTAARANDDTRWYVGTGWSW